MFMTLYVRDRLTAKAAGVLALAAVAEILIDGSGLGAVVGGFALFWLAALVGVRRAVLHVGAARLSVSAAAIFGVVLVDDPSLLSWVLFWTALSIATLLPRHGFDDALAWSGRLAWHGLTTLVSPIRDMARVAAIRDRKGTATGVSSAIRLLVIPLTGGAIFMTLFASANPLISNAFAQIVLPDVWTMSWRGLLAVFVVTIAWGSLRPSAAVTRPARYHDRAVLVTPDPGAATLVLSLITFNAIFAIENSLDVAFLWSGAPLPVGVTLADYAHRGAYSLIVTALLAGLFVLVALRPGSTGATNPMARRLVALWISQNLLLVASSALRTLDYVDAYGMTVLRLSALAWMALVATGLALIGCRFLFSRSAAWLINANALAAALILTLSSVIDLGATAAAWNTRVALTRGLSGPPLDLCYLARLGSSAVVSLAMLERHARRPAVRDRLAWLRWRAQVDIVRDQSNWRSWTPRGGRRLDAIETITGLRRPALRSSPDGRGCDGSINPPPALQSATAPTAPPSAMPLPLTQGAQR